MRAESPVMTTRGRPSNSTGSARSCRLRWAEVPAAAARQAERTGSCAMNPAGSLGKGAPERKGVVAAGFQMNLVRPGGGQRAGSLLPPPLRQVSQPTPDIAASGVDQHPPARLRVHDLNPPGFGQLVLPRLIQGDGHHLVSGSEAPQRL